MMILSGKHIPCSKCEGKGDILIKDVGVVPCDICNGRGTIDAAELRK